MLPHTLEVGLLGDPGGHLMRHYHILLLDDLGSKLTESLVLSLEGGSTLWCASVHTEQDVLVLVGLGEGVENTVAL